VQSRTVEVLLNNWVKVNFYLPLQSIILMKCSELLRILKKDGWFVISQKGSHLKLAHPVKTNRIIFPDHGSQEVGIGLKNRILKEAGLK
jgi:predicted RNA binding protein YcfA (HicA-like mRNA interferase family)